MQRTDIDQEPEENKPMDNEPEEPVPGIEHYPEPDAENIMPVEDRPGTF